MRIFFAEQGLTRVSGETYCCTSQPENPRKTSLSGKKTIYGRTLVNGSHLFLIIGIWGTGVRLEGERDDHEEL